MPVAVPASYETHSADVWGARSNSSTSSDGVFFFQAEDGIRDLTVTGVQTCALPICKQLHILVVDDEPHILYYMRATLESWGHSVEVASDGAYALERAIAGDFDVIICDLRMPHLSGRDMYQKLARQDPRAAERIIFATGDTVRGDTLQFLETLGRPYLHKPFTLSELRAALGHAANQPA